VGNGKPLREKKCELSTRKHKERGGGCVLGEYPAGDPRGKNSSDESEKTTRGLREGPRVQRRKETPWKNSLHEDGFKSWVELLTKMREKPQRPGKRRGVWGQNQTKKPSINRVVQKKARQSSTFPIIERNKSKVARGHSREAKKDNARSRRTPEREGRLLECTTKRTRNKTNSMGKTKHNFSPRGLQEEKGEKTRERRGKIRRKRRATERRGNKKAPKQKKISDTPAETSGKGYLSLYEGVAAKLVRGGKKTTGARQ